MAILGLSLFKYTSDWEFETSEDTSISVFATISTGRIKLRKTRDHHETLMLNYRCLWASASRGLPVGLSQSHFEDPCGGYGPVVTNRHFGYLSFPCMGYMFNAGATLGALSAPHGPAPHEETINGGSWTMIFFGINPVFAGLRCWGQFHATTPGIGIGGGIASFSVDE